MKHKNWLSILTFIASFCFFSTSMAATSPEGYWKTISDVTHKERSVMHLTVVNGTLYGKVIRVFPEAGDTGICVKCPGSFKGQKILGMQVLWGLKQTSDGVWNNGKILDPKTGKIYSAKITLNPEGNQLMVRGYMGMSLLGRTQTWVRVNKPSKKDIQVTTRSVTRTSVTSVQAKTPAQNQNVQNQNTQNPNVQNQNVQTQAPATNQ